MELTKIHQYKIEHQLGSGLHGAVYFATDTRLLRPVVLKIVHENLSANKDAGRQILEEARLASAIQHPNVCAIYEAGEFHSRPFIVMQYVPGHTLYQLITSGPLNVQFALSIGIQVASGLAEAHRMGILHRDLKPANIIITEGGLVKILDFGMAKKRDLSVASEPVGNAPAAPKSSEFGTMAYMAPEQYFTRRSNEQTDIFSMGVILYEMVAGKHPYWRPGQDALALRNAIQFTTPPSPRTVRPDIPEALDSAILTAMERQPANRFRSAAELSESLKTMMKSMQFEVGVVPGENSAVLPSPAPGSKRKEGFFSLLAERFLQSGQDRVPENSIAVLPFQNVGARNYPPYYGLALADMVASRLARMPSVIVRPPSAFLSLSNTQRDAFSAGRKLNARYGINGNFLSSENEFTLNWQLLDIEEKTVLTGGTLAVPSLDLLKMQNEISTEVFAALHKTGIIQHGKAQPSARSLPDRVSEEYLMARTLLTRFLWSSSQRQDLEKAKNALESVLEKAPWFASAHAGLGVTHLYFVINGFGGLTHFMSAQRHLEKTLELDPDHVEAKVYRAYTYLWRGEKENARYEIQFLLKRAGQDAEVNFGAGVILQLDGMFEESLKMFGRALEANSTAAPRIYNRRARIYHYLGQLEFAWHEVEKGLALEPDHLLLRTTQGYLHFREGHYRKAIEILESVLKDDPYRRLTYPTLAMCYRTVRQAKKASTLITDELLAAAAADCEMAYRLATFCVVDENTSEALHWLRKAIYLGNENHPWLSRNPAWAEMQDNKEFRKILSDLKRTHKKNLSNWEKFLAELRA